ncbi:MAG: RNA polymerase sigma factor [Terriglobia bacterium]
MKPKSTSSRMEDARLRAVVERARGGEHDAFGELYNSYYHWVLGRCRRLLGRQEDAEDAAAEVFVKIQCALVSHNPSLPFLPWLLSVASHHSIDRLRRREVEARLFAAEDVTATVPEGAEASPLSQVLNGEQRQRVRELVDRLPDHYRFPLLLRYYSEMSYNEIAKALGMGPNSVKTLIFRAKKELRRKMEPSVRLYHKVVAGAGTQRPDGSGRSVSKALTVNSVRPWGRDGQPTCQSCCEGQMNFCGAS